MLYLRHLKGEYMASLLAKIYKNNKAKAPVVAKEGKKLSGKQKIEKNNQTKKVETENVNVAKEVKTLILY